MPFKSKAQSRLMHGVASGDIKGSGVPKKVARDFVGAGHGKSQAKLPDRAQQTAMNKAAMNNASPQAKARAISQAAAGAPSVSTRMSDVVMPRRN